MLCASQDGRRVWGVWIHVYIQVSLVAQLVKNPPAMQETPVWYLGWEIPWRQEQVPTPVFLPRESHGQRSLAGYSPWGLKESDWSEWLSLSLSFIHTAESLRCSPETTTTLLIGYTPIQNSSLNLQNRRFIFCVFVFYVCIIYVKSIINPLQYSTI